MNSLLMMEEQIFYTPDISSGIFEMPREESKHLVKVLRKVEGEPVLCTNGKGSFFDCKILIANASSCSLEVIREYAGEDIRDFKLIMAVAPTKNNSRYEWFIEKAVEIGVDEIIPIITSRSERRNINAERFTRIAVAAMKQSRKSRLPIMHPALKLDEALKKCVDFRSYIAWLDDSVDQHLADKVEKGNDIAIFIGPEGDFTADEVAMTIKAGGIAVHLGSYRLRTETAAITACHTIQLKNRKK